MTDDGFNILVFQDDRFVMEIAPEKRPLENGILRTVGAHFVAADLLGASSSDIYDNLKGRTEPFAIEGYSGTFDFRWRHAYERYCEVTNTPFPTEPQRLKKTCTAKSQTQTEAQVKESFDEETQTKDYLDLRRKPHPH